jgi:glycosyltransferase involved in cell wall biosynthesis/SAM-dependent methyltransferase
MKPAPKLLIVSYFFPPMNSAGVYRIAGFGRHLPEQGWEPIVLTVSRPERHERVDPELEAVGCRVLRVPHLMLKRYRQRRPKPEPERAERDPSRRFLKTIRSRLSELFRERIYCKQGQKVGWLIPAAWAALRRVKAEKIPVLLTSSPPHFIHLAGLLVKTLSRVRWIADFRDPWMDIPFYRSLPGWQRAVNRWLERMVLNAADAVIANTDGNRKLLVQRYPDLADRITVIPNGYDIEPESAPAVSSRPDGPVVMAYTGEIYWGMADGFLEALKGLKRRDPELSKRLRIRVGGLVDERYLTRISEYGLSDLFEYRGFVSFHESLEMSRRADLLLYLVPPHRPEWVPSKLYTYLALGRPIFGVVPEGDASEIIRRADAGDCVGHEPPDRIEAELLKAMEQCRRGGPPSAVQEAVLDQYSRKHLTAELAVLFGSQEAPSPRALAESVRRRGWTEGVARYLRSLPADHEKQAALNLINPCRQAAWIVWLKGHADGRVLNLDTTPGTTSMALSYLFKEVTALFGTAEEAGGATARAEQAKRPNIRIGTWPASGRPLLEEHGFDAVVIGDLERTLGEWGIKDPDRFFQDLADLLRPDGIVYIGIRKKPVGLNRGRGGDLDLTQVVRRIKGFREATRLEYYPSLDRMDLIRCGPKSGGRTDWWNRFRSWVKGEGYGILLSRSGTPLQGGLIEEIRARCGAVRPLGAAVTAHVGSFSTLLVKLPEQIVRIPFGPEADAQCRRNFEALSRLREGVPFRIPTPLFSESAGEMSYYVESRLEGREPPHRWTTEEESQNLCDQAVSLVTGLHGSTVQRVRLGEREIENLFIGAVTEIGSDFEEGVRRTLSAGIVRMAHRLSGTVLPLVHTHGDFKRTNLICTEDGRAVGVVDWDLSRPSGFPLKDLVLFLAYERMLRWGEPIPETIRHIVCDPGFFENRWVRAYRDRMGLEKVWLRWLGFMTLVYYFRSHIGRIRRTDGGTIHRLMAPTLQTVLEEAVRDLS